MRNIFLEKNYNKLLNSENVNTENQGSDEILGSFLKILTCIKHSRVPVTVLCIPDKQSIISTFSYFFKSFKKTKKSSYFFSSLHNYKGRTGTKKPSHKNFIFFGVVTIQALQKSALAC